MIKIIKKHRPSARSILDVACGVGRHDRILSKKGFIVTGVDMSKDLIGIAKKHDKKTKYALGDMRYFKLQEKFDCVLSVWDAYVYLSRERDLKSFLERCHEHLNKNGLLILDARNFWQQNPNDRLNYKHFITKDGWSVARIAKRETILRDRVHESIFTVILVNLHKKKSHIIVEQELNRIWPLDELLKFFKGKFKLVEKFGDFDIGTCYNKFNSPRMILMARKL